LEDFKSSNPQIPKTKFSLLEKLYSSLRISLEDSLYSPKGQLD
jgi:hypothetical protein